ncbi:hypothetical protein JCM13304A_16720 [Desulfothermus okinawensis JCM 13304]
MAHEIKLVKIVTGDYVIGKWVEEDGKLKDPAILQTIPTQNGISMALMPFGYPFDQEIEGEISKDHIIYWYKNIPAELETKYLEASSNLTISSSSDLKNLENLMGGGQKSGRVTNISDLLKG